MSIQYTILNTGLVGFKVRPPRNENTYKLYSFYDRVHDEGVSNIFRNKQSTNVIHILVKVCHTVYDWTMR